MKTVARVFVSIALLCASALAQGKLGDVAPDFEAQFVRSQAQRLSDFRGQVVLLDFWRTTCEPCRKDVPHLNELQAKYGDKGFVILGVTNEDEKRVKDHMAAAKFEFTVARVKGPKTDVAYGVESFPRTFLIDASGRIVWSGTSSMLDEAELKDQLAKVSFVRALPESFVELNELIERRKLGKAHEALSRALVQTPESPDLQRVKSEIETTLAEQLEAAQALAGASDFGLAVDLYDDIAHTYAPLPGAVEAEAAADAIRRDPATKDELGAHAQMKKGEELSARGERDQAVRTWQVLLKKFPATKAAKRATVALRQRGVV